MGKTKDTGHLAHIVQYDASNNITIPAGLKVNGADNVMTAAAMTSTLGGYVPASRIITINGTAFDLTSDRSWTIAAGLTSFNTRTGAITLSSGDVTTALGFTPYNATNPAGYITGISFANVSAKPTTLAGYGITDAASSTHNHDTLYVPVGRTITINGTAFDLSANRSWTISGSDATKLPLAGGTLTGNVIASGDTYTTYGPNSTWASYLRVGGNGRTVTGDSYASIVTTNGNIHLDAGNSRAIYLNYYAGTTGVAFGSGASSVVASMDSAGNLWKGATIGAGTQYVFNSGTWAINVTGTAGGVAWGNVSSKPDQIVYYAGFNLDANTMPANSTGFTYSVNAPATGPVTRFSEGGYSLQFNAAYSGNGTTLYYRTRNGDAGSFNSWWRIYTDTYRPYSDNSGALGGYGSSNFLGKNGNSYYQQDTWIQLNGVHGLYAPAYNNAHLYPNDASYGSWRILGSRNGWTGLHFGGANGITLMMNEGEFGFHREGVGWVARFTSGTGYFNISGNAESVSNGMYLSGDQVISNQKQFLTNNGSYAVNGSNSPALQAFSTGNNSAFMSFHRGGYYAVNFGLDADNWMRIGGWSAAANRWQLNTVSGDMVVNGDVTAFSDARVKENVVTVDNALEKVLALRGVYYNRIDSEDKKRKLGVIAQETLTVVPEVVNTDAFGTYNVSYGNLGGLFIEAFKDQQRTINVLTNQLNHLKAIIDGITR